MFAFFYSALVVSIRIDFTEIVKIIFEQEYKIKYFKRNIQCNSQSILTPMFSLIMKLLTF